eukprot:m.175840 g.175840  ORF g.175840 m.175840 type:complete len:132 (-) comp10424_c0_seq5:117-512(-)
MPFRASDFVCSRPDSQRRGKVCFVVWTTTFSFLSVSACCRLLVRSWYLKQMKCILLVHILRTWQKDKVLLFDDSFEHSVDFPETAREDHRAVFIVDVWHPDVTPAERKALSQVFDFGGESDPAQQASYAAP